MIALNVGREHKTEICFILPTLLGVSICIDSERIKVWRNNVFINTHKFDLLFIISFLFTIEI